MGIRVDLVLKGFGIEKGFMVEGFVVQDQMWIAGSSV